MLSVVHNYYYLLALLIIHSLRTSICVWKYLYMLSVTFDDQGGGAFSVDLSRSRANFRGPEILYIFRRNCYTSQADANSSFPDGTHISMISNSVIHMRSYANSAIADIAENSTQISPLTPRDRRHHRADRRHRRAERRRLRIKGRRLRIERRYRRIE